jgi:hypothetical protein
LLQLSCHSCHAVSAISVIPAVAKKRNEKRKKRTITNRRAFSMVKELAKKKISVVKGN